METKNLCMSWTWFISTFLAAVVTTPCKDKNVEIGKQNQVLVLIDSLQRQEHQNGEQNPVLFLIDSPTTPSPYSNWYQTLGSK